MVSLGMGKSAQYTALRLAIALTLGSSCINSISRAASDDLGTLAESSRLRVGYMFAGWDSETLDLLPKMAAAGMNVAVVKFSALTAPPSLRDENLLVKWANACASNNVLFVPIISFFGQQEAKWLSYEHTFVGSSVATVSTPCPWESAAFHSSVTDRWKTLAEISLQLPIAGVLLDPELYGSDMYLSGDLITYTSPCFCDHCYIPYAQQHALSTTVAPTERHGYLENQSHTDAYSEYLQDRMAALAAEARRQVRMINPELQIGSYNIDHPYPFARGFAKGCATQDHPVVVLCGTTQTGYSQLVNEIAATFTANETPATVIPGLFMQRFPTENLAEQSYYCAKNSSGYWLFTLQSFVTEGFVPLSEPESDYWAALATANAELDKLALDPLYESTLQIGTMVPDLPPQEPNDDPVRTMLGPVLFPLPEVPADTKIWLRRQADLVVIGRQGQQVSGTVTTVPLGANPWNWASRIVLFDGSGHVLVDAIAEPYETESFAFTPAASGPYFGIFDAGNNAAELKLSQTAYSIDTSEKPAQFITHVSPIYLWLPPGVTQAQVELAGDGGRETYLARLVDQSGAVLAQGTVGRSALFDVAVIENSAGQVVRFEAQRYADNILEDVRIQVISGFSPFVSPYRAGLIDEVQVGVDTDDDDPDDGGSDDGGSDEPVNTAPTFSPVGAQNVISGEQLTFTLAASDPDNDPLTYAATNRPAGATFTAPTFTWTPTDADLGQHTVTFTVTDSINPVVSTNVAIEVTAPANAAPAIAPLPDPAGPEGAPLTFTLTATDPDVDPLTWRAENLPPAATFTNGQFAWTPPYDAAGAHTIRVYVTDGTHEVSRDLTLTIANTNRPPEFMSVMDRSGEVGSELRFWAMAADPDGDPVAYSASALPPGAAYSNTGVFAWTPGPHQTGSHDILLLASDGHDSAQRPVTLTVHTAGIDDQPPVVTRSRPTPASIQVPVNTLISFDLSDAGTGIAPATVQIRVNDALVYSGDTPEYQGPAGRCVRLANGTGYRFYYEPAHIFSYDELVTVQVDACDQAGNALTAHTYDFQTEMILFGPARILDEAGAPAHVGRIAAASTTAGTWLAWDQGAESSRDVYAACLAHDGTLLQGPIPLANSPADERQPDLALDPTGHPVVVWQTYHPDGDWDVHAALLSPAGQILETRQLSDQNLTDYQTPMHQVYPRIAIDAAGRACTAWRTAGPDHQGVSICQFTPGQPAVDVAHLTSRNHPASAPAIAADPAGDIYVAWEDRRNSRYDIYAARRSTNWQHVLLVANGATAPALAIDPAGQVHLAWQQLTAGQQDVYYAPFAPGLTDAPATGANVADDTTAAHQRYPALAAGPAGQLFLAWQDERPTDPTDSDIYLIRLDQPGRVNVLATPETSPQLAPALAIDPDGDPLLAYAQRPETALTQLALRGATAIAATPTVSQRIVAATGGIVGTPPDQIDALGEVCLEVPPGALWTDMDLAIWPVKNPPAPVSAETIAAAWEFGPSSSMEFAAPITVTIPYQPIAALDTSVAWYNPQTGIHSQSGLSGIEDIPLPNGLRAIRFRTTHFSQYVLTQHSVSVTTGSSSSGGGGGCMLTPNPAPDAALSWFLPYAAALITWQTLRRKDRIQT